MRLAVCWTAVVLQALSLLTGVNAQSSNSTTGGNNVDFAGSQTFKVSVDKLRLLHSTGVVCRRLWPSSSFWPCCY
jgi:hypothetical protein